MFIGYVIFFPVKCHNICIIFLGHFSCTYLFSVTEELCMDIRVIYLFLVASIFQSILVI